MKTPARLLAIAAAIGCVDADRAALADEWRQSVQVPMTLEHDSNLILSSVNSKGVTRSIIAPTYTLIGNYGTDELNLGLGIRVERSTSQFISPNRQDPNLSLGWQRKTETGGYGVLAKYDEASTRLSQLAENGVIVGEGTRKTQSLGGNWTNSVSDRSSLTANMEYKTVSYDKGTLTDFRNLSADLAWNYAWSERADPFLRFSVSRFDPEKAGIASSENYMATGGVKFRTSEQVEWAVQGGTSTIVSLGTRKTSGQGGLMMRYIGNRLTGELNAARSVSASGQGGFFTSDQLKGLLAYELADRRRAGIDLMRQNNKTTIPNAMQMAGIWVSQEYSSFWSSRIYFQHKQRMQSGLPDASANVLGVVLTYSHPDF